MSISYEELRIAADDVGAELVELRAKCERLEYQVLMQKRFIKKLRDQLGAEFESDEV